MTESKPTNDLTIIEQRNVTFYRVPIMGSHDRQRTYARMIFSSLLSWQHSVWQL
jgi:hypothetical protein